MFGLPPATARAIPVFAHRYGLSCQACHSTVPALNEFGRQFLAGGYRLPSPPTPTFPVAIKVNLAYSSAADPGGLPKAIVDEVELLTGGDIGKRVSYFGEAYVVDGGRPGSVRDLWLRYDMSPPEARIRSGVRAGQFTLPLPVDPETFRETFDHYAIFDQAIGANPFNFFDPHMGVEFRLASRSTSLSLLALRGHDKQSGLPASGSDWMASAQRGVGLLTLSAYRYVGSRRTGAVTDAFWRQGYALQAPAGRATFTALAQSGGDTSADGLGTFDRSGGGFAQARWEFSSALTGVARYDITSDAASTTRATTLALVHRLQRNSKLTLEEVWHGNRRDLNAALLFAY